jgi:Lhr-like helicase
MAPAEEKRSGQNLHQQALEVLKTTFGFAEFFPAQWEAIQRVLEPKDTLVIMPTGGGKSLCYQLPALLRPGLTVVVSPLVALMRDQVRQLEQVGVRAGGLNHLVPLREYQSIMHQVRAGQIRRRPKPSCARKRCCCWNKAGSLASQLMKRIVFRSGDTIFVLSTASLSPCAADFRKRSGLA